VKRSVSLFLGLMALLYLGGVPAAEATGAGVCTISGSINLSPSSAGRASA
jgi:hypothetical protein